MVQNLAFIHIVCDRSHVQVRLQSRQKEKPVATILSASAALSWIIARTPPSRCLDVAHPDVSWQVR